MQETIKVRCRCGKSYRVAVRRRGEKLRCPNPDCRNRFMIPPLTPTAPQQAPALRRRPARVPRPRPLSRLLVGALLVGLLVVGSGMTMATTAWGGGASSLLEAVPADMDLVLRLKLGEGLERLGVEREISTCLQAQLGSLELDPVQELEEVVVALGVQEETGAPRALILLRGHLELQRLASQVDPRVRFSEQSYGGSSYYLARHPELPEPVALAWLGAGRTALGDEATVRQALQCLAGQQRAIVQDAKMARLIDRTADADLLWCVARSPSAVRESLPEQMQGLEALLVRVADRGAQVELEAAGQFDSRISAAAAHDAVEQGLAELEGLFSQVAPGDLELDAFLLGSSVKRDGTRLSLQLRFSSAVSSELAAQGLRDL